MRFRIAEMLIVIAVVAFALVSLQNANEWYESLFFTFTLGVILTAALMAIARRNPVRGFWIAFAVSSGAYLFFAHSPDNPAGFGFRQSEYCTKILRYDGPEFTTQMLRLVYEKSRDQQPPDINDGGVVPVVGGVFNIQDADPFGPADENPFGDTEQVDNPFGGDETQKLENQEDNPFAVENEDEEKNGLGGLGGQPDELFNGEPESEFTALTDLIRKTIGPASWTDSSGFGKIKPFPVNITCMVPANYDDFAPFMRIGHCVWALAIGWFAGHFCLFVASGQDSGSPKSSQDQDQSLSR